MMRVTWQSVFPGLVHPVDLQDAFSHIPEALGIRDLAGGPEVVPVGGVIVDSHGVGHVAASVAAVTVVVRRVENIERWGQMGIVGKGSWGTVGHVICKYNSFYFNFLSILDPKLIT